MWRREKGGDLIYDHYLYAEEDNGGLNRHSRRGFTSPCKTFSRAARSSSLAPSATALYLIGLPDAGASRGTVRKTRRVTPGQ